MDLAWDDPRMRKFVTNVGLITSNGEYGNNIMSAEWTHRISDAPSLIMVNLHDFDATSANIIKTKEFGVNIAAKDQNIISSIAGENSGKKVDKIKLLEEFGAKFYKAKKINALMLKGASLNAECTLIKSEKIGDHIMFIGEVVELDSSDNESLVYHKGKYFEIGQMIHKPAQDVLDRIAKLSEKYKK